MTDVCTMCGDSGVDRWGQSCDCEAWMPMPPQPLSSDEESQAREWFPRIASESDHVWLLQRNRTLQIIKAMWATIDALTTENATVKAEIEGYRQALEKACDWMVSTNDYESLSPAGHAITRDAIATMRRVLAGKEAQSD